MGQHTPERIKKVKEHFFSTNLSCKDFCTNFYEQYGYQQPNGFRKFMINHGILVGARSEHTIKQYKL